MDSLASKTRIVNIGVTISLGFYLSYKLIYTKRKQYFSTNEMRLFFLCSSIQPFFLWLFWDKLNIETENGHYKKSFQTPLLIVSILYSIVALFPTKMKWVMIPIILGKLVAFKDWCVEMPHFNTVSSVALFADLIWAVGYGMTFIQLNQKSDKKEE